ncbi:MAG: hypothetical protein C0474_01230 [Sphingobium sp.]|nr:hypothetical protein [Sphingobium sp.]
MTAATDPPIEIAIADARMTNLVQQAKGRGSKTLVTTRNIAKVGAWSMVSTPFIIPPVGVAVMTRFMCVDRMLGQSGHRFGPELTGLSAEAFCGGGGGRRRACLLLPDAGAARPGKQENTVDGQPPEIAEQCLRPGV